MKVCVTGATGFLGAHVTRGLIERGDEVRVTYRDPERLEHLKGLEFRRAKTDVLDFKAMRRAVRDVEVLFHTVGFVGSFPAERVWRLNAHAPVVAVEAAAAEGVRRVVLTSTISVIGPATDGGPADESTAYPEEWLHLAYPDSKHEGELAALEAGVRHGVDVVVVNPAYLLGVPVDRSQPGETSTRTVGNYLRRRLPAVIDAGMSTLADGLGRAGSLGLLHPVRLGQRVLGRRVIAGV
jgi:dihydroflavonol-4-reductase